VAYKILMLFWAVGEYLKNWRRRQLQADSHTARG